MTNEQRAAYIISQSVAALIEALGMVAANKERELHGNPPAYGEEYFYSLERKYCIGTNDVLSFMKD